MTIKNLTLEETEPAIALMGITLLSIMSIFFGF